MEYMKFYSSVSAVDMIVADKSLFESPQLFMTEVIRFLDHEIYPACGIAFDYKGFRLKEGRYMDIIDQHMQLMNQKAEIEIRDVKTTYRIKRSSFDPCCDEFVIETEKAYIAFLWSLTE